MQLASSPWQDHEPFSVCGVAQSLVQTYKFSVRWIALTPHHRACSCKESAARDGCTRRTRADCSRTASLGSLSPTGHQSPQHNLCLAFFIDTQSLLSPQPCKSGETLDRRGPPRQDASKNFNYITPVRHSTVAKEPSIASFKNTRCRISAAEDRRPM